MTPAITPELRERAGKDRPLSRRGFFLGTSAVAVAAALPVMPVAAEAVAAPVAVRGPMTLPLLKELSERALPILEKHFPDLLQDQTFLAEAGDNYHGLVIQCDCPPDDRAAFAGCECQWHPLAGTPMIGGMSGYEEPEWYEETAYEALCKNLEWIDRPASMTEVEWVEVLAMAGLTPADHAKRMAWLEGEIASLDAPPATPLATGEAA